MLDVSKLCQYELIELLKNAACEITKREKEAYIGDDGLKLAKKIEQSVKEYDIYNDNRLID